jgi:hypothetical protein
LLNTEADFYSKIFDYDDWEINQLVFNYLDQIWGPFSFDCFADNKNYKVAKFNSQFWTRGTEGVDAFAYDWSNDNNWLVPPIHYIPNVINHMLKYRCYGTLVVPKWKSALFWPCIVKKIAVNSNGSLKTRLNMSIQGIFSKQVHIKKVCLLDHLL